MQSTWEQVVSASSGTHGFQEGLSLSREESHSLRGTGHSTAVRRAIPEHRCLEDVAEVADGVHSCLVHWGSQGSSEASVLLQTFVVDL